jgi:hypothetical protein
MARADNASAIPDRLPACRKLLVVLESSTIYLSIFHVAGAWKLTKDAAEHSNILPDSTPTNNPFNCFRLFVELRG